MKRNIILYPFFLAFALVLFSCQGLVDGINEDPDKFPVEDVPPLLLLTGAQIANINFQAGHLSRISALYSGQLFGFQSVYADVYRYNISTAESNSSWNKIYVGVVANTREITAQASGDNLLLGIARIVEANALGTAASIFGDVPFSQINQEGISDPIFDSQLTVLENVQGILDQAITDLNNGATRSMAEDIHFRGNKDKWLAAAYTLKARYYMLTRNYAGALAAAQKGIMSDANTWEFVPPNSGSAADDRNQFWTTLDGARGGDIGSGDSYLTQLLDTGSGVYRGNAKTDETARSGYNYVEENDGDANSGIIQEFEPHPLASYAENQLTLAEAGTRVNGFDEGLSYLNDYRAFLNSGGVLNANFSGLAYLYDPYDAADFANGGIENMDDIDNTRALLREIIEERYVSGFLTWMPFDDHRRLRKSDADLVVPFPLNDSSAPNHVGRLPYPSDELNANTNAPSDDPGIFEKTEANK